MTTYYFADSGDDGATGLDSDHPKKNPSSVSFGANDVCLINRGYVWTAPSGTSAIALNAGGVRIGAYGLGNVPKIVGAQTSRGITVNNVAGCTVEDVWIDNVSGLTATRYGVIVTTTGGSETVTSNTTLRRVRVTNVATNGATGCNGIMAWGDGNTIDACEADTVGTDCFWMKCRNLTFTDNVALNPAQDDDIVTPGGDCFQFPGGGFDYSNLLFRGNVGRHETTDNNKNCLIILDCIGTGFVFEENEFYAAVATGQTNVYIDVAGAIVRNNIIVGGDYGLYLASASGNQAYGNRISGANYGVRLASSARGQKLYHNVIRGNGTGFYGSANDATTVLKNNVFLSNTTGVARHGNMVQDYNDFYGNTTAESIIAGSGSMGAHSIATDPLLSASDYPERNSPLIGAGTNVGILSGYDGKVFLSPAPIGAYEWYEGSYLGESYFGNSYWGDSSEIVGSYFGNFFGRNFWGTSYWSTPDALQHGTTARAYLSAAIQAERTAAPSIDAALIAETTATTWMGAQIMFPQSATVSIDALLNAQNFANPGIDAAIRYQRTASAIVGSYVLRSDYFINVAWTAVSGATAYWIYWDTVSHAGGDFSAWPNSRLLGNVTSYRLDGLIEGTTYYIAVAATDATLYPGKLATEVSALSQSPGTSFTTFASFDAVIRTSVTATASASAAIVAQRVSQPMMEAAVRWARTAAPSLDSAIRLTPTASSSMDAALVRTPDRSQSIDAALLWTPEASAGLSAFLQAESATESTLSMGAAIEVGYVAGASIDAALQDALSATADMDAVLFSVGSIAADMDAEIGFQGFASPGMDAYLSVGPTAHVALSAWVSAMDAATWRRTWRRKHRKCSHEVLF
jgi:parallel beta-helix repeat protein